MNSKIIYFVVVPALLILCVISWRSLRPASENDVDEPASVEELVTLYREAHRSGEVDRVMRACSFEGISEKSRNVYKGLFEYKMGKTIDKTEFLAVPDENESADLDIMRKGNLLVWYDGEADPAENYNVGVRRGIYYIYFEEVTFEE